MSWFSDLFSPPAANVQAPTMQTYNPTGMGGAESNLLGGISNLGQFNLYGQNIPEASAITRGIIDNPGAPGWLSGAQYAGGMAQQGANNAFNAGGGLYSLGANVAGTAFDPQNALYARTVQQLQDQTRAGQAARGIQTTPYGAGLEDQQMRNFNIDWQNQQLQRQLQGLSGVGSAFGQANQMQSQAPGQYLQGSAMPYQVGQQIGQNQLGALSTLGGFGQQASQIPQQQIQDYYNYLGWGNQANQGANTANNQLFQNQLRQSELGWNQQAGMFGGLGRLAGAALPFIPGVGSALGGLGMGSFMGSGSFNRG